MLALRRPPAVGAGYGGCADRNVGLTAPAPCYLRLNPARHEEEGPRGAALDGIICCEFGSNLADFGNDLGRELLECGEELVGLFLTQGRS